MVVFLSKLNIFFKFKFKIIISILIKIILLSIHFLIIKSISSENTKSPYPAKMNFINLFF